MKTVERISVVQQVVNNIQQYIQEENIAVGNKLPTEMAFCEKLGVGRGTIREAMRILQAKGIVEIKPGRGAFLADCREPKREELTSWFTQNEVEIKDVTEVRMAIEPLAVRLAIRRATDEDIRKLKEIQEKAVKAAWAEDPQTLALCDELFHDAIMQCSRNKLLASLNKQITACLKLFRQRTFYFPNNVENFIPAHAAIIEAFEKRDVALGERRMTDHLLRVNLDLENSKI